MQPFVEAKLFRDALFIFPGAGDYPDARRRRMRDGIPKLQPAVGQAARGSICHFFNALVFFAVSLRGRRTSLGVYINVVFMLNALSGMYGCQLLLVGVLESYLACTVLLNSVLLAVVIMDCIQHRILVTAYLFIPGTIIDLLFGSLSVRLYLVLRRWRKLGQTTSTALPEHLSGPALQNRGQESTTIEVSEATQGEAIQLATTDGQAELARVSISPGRTPPGGPLPANAVNADLLCPTAHPSPEDSLPDAGASKGKAARQRPFGHPEYYLCPITLELMRDPVVDANGHTFERSAITKALKRRPGVSPKTNAPYPDGNARLKTNYATKHAIEEYMEEHGIEAGNGGAAEEARVIHTQAELR